MTYGYLRLSTNEDKQQNSFEIQKKHIQDKYKIDTFFEDTLSGSTDFDKRPSWLKLMSVIQPLDEIIVHRMDRLSRDTLNFLVVEKALKQRQVSLKFIDGVSGDTPMEQMVRTILSAVGQMERSMISTRVKQTMELMKSEGKFLGGLPPYGYSEAKGYLVKNTSEQEVIALMRQFRDSGMSYNRIATALNDRETPTRSGTPWKSIQVSRALKYK